MSNSVRPHRRQPIRLLYPWDSTGKNTGVGCHFLLQCMKVKSESGVAQSCQTLREPMDCSLPGSSAHGIFQARVLEWVAIAFSINVYKYIQFPFVCSQSPIAINTQHADAFKYHSKQPRLDSRAETSFWAMLITETCLKELWFDWI